jgi:hypothetical protein
MIILLSRTGNSQNPGSGSWSKWSEAYTNSFGDNITSPDNRYIQYFVLFASFDINITPLLSSVMIEGCHYYSSGEFITELFEPEGLIKWGKLDTQANPKGQRIRKYWSIDENSPWHLIVNGGDLSSVPVTTGKIKFKFELSTTNTTVSPVVNNFTLTYSRLGPLDSIEVSPNPTEIIAGKEVEFIAKGFDPYGREVEIDSIWSTTVGTINNGTLIAQTKVGSGYVNATFGGITGSAIVNILPRPLDHIIVTPDKATVITGEKQIFFAKGFDEYENVIPIEPEWETDVGIMENNQFIAQQFAARGTVNAFVGDITGFADVTVKLNSTTHHPPKILSVVPDQVLIEDSEPKILNLAIFEWDDEDSGEDLLWYLTDFDEDLYTVTGSYSQEDIMTFIPKPDAFGDDRTILWLIDSDNMTTNQLLWVNITPVNDKPEINGVPDISLHYDEPYTFDYSNYISDVETPDENLILTVEEPAGQQYTSTVGLNVTYNYPKNMFGNTIPITLIVSDGKISAQDKLQVSITDNHAPSLIKPFDDIIMFEGEIFNNIFDLDEHFIDPDGDPLAYFFTAEFIIITHHENNSITLSSPPTWSGTETITFRAMDPFGAMAEGYLNMKVLEVNDPPQISPIPDIHVHYDYKYEFNLSKYIIDPDNDTKELIIWTSDTKNISFLTTDNALMILEYPMQFLGQSTKIQLFVSDGIATTLGEFIVHITDNFPPSIKKEMADLYFNEDSQLLNALNLSDYFLDMDGEQLSYSFELEDIQNISIIINTNNTIDLVSKQDWSGSRIHLPLTHCPNKAEKLESVG